VQRMSYVKRSIITATCIALCPILPMAFHSIQNAGSIFSPMHIPVLLCGLICGPGFGLLCGLAGPLLSTIFTGMPPTAYLPPMMIELAVYGLVGGLMINLIRTRKLYVDLYSSLIIAMIAGRIVAGVAKALIFVPGGYSMTAWITSYFVTCWPGLVMHLILVPMIVLALMKARIIPERYPAKA
jgi:LytS/YehU family sensor histidine kinase